MDHPIEPSILDAIEQGRGERGGTTPQAWSRRRALVLTLVYQRKTYTRVAGEVGLTSRQVASLVNEGCDAVLRSRAVSAAADSACAERWQSACETGDADVCLCLQRRRDG